MRTPSKAVLLSANGPAFSSGHDLKEIYSLQQTTDGADAKKNSEELAALFASCGKVMKTLQTYPVPVVCAVHGAAHAAGCEMV